MLWLGIGCQRYTHTDFIHQSIQFLLQQYGLQIANLDGMATLNTKADEIGITTVAKIYNLQLHFFSAKALKQISVANPSPQVNERVDTFSVAEAAAILAVRAQLEIGNSAKRDGNLSVSLLIPKTIFKSTNLNPKKSVTLAVAEAGYF